MSKYPSEIDTDSELPPVADNITEIGGEAINSLRAAVLAIERVIGTSPQGSVSTLSLRLSQVLNDDGTFKAAALISSGLIALPITNEQIGSSAAIQESKLDLDISTQSLQNQINQDHVDILALQDAVAQDINRLAQHALGQIDRHDGYQIDITALSGHADIDTVEAALDFIWGTFLDHKSAISGIEHAASTISYTPSGEGLITSTNVQDAITETDAGFIEDRRKHNDSAHSDGVSNDGYRFLDGQAATNDAALKLTRYQTFAGGQDIVKIGHPNAASVKTKGFEPGAITSATSAFNIVVSIGAGIERTLAITNLHTAAYPSSAARVSLNAVVDYINAQAATLTNHFPISAFASPDGELVLQHNIDRDDCTIKITSTASSAVSALGFGDIEGVQVSRLERFYYVVNGNPSLQLKIVSSGSLTQSGLSSVVDLGVDVTGTGLDLFANSLLHVFDHTDAAANGTYRISQISPASPSPSTSIGLSTGLSAGSFSYVIYSECFNINFVGSPKVLDLYIDDDFDPVVSSRAAITFGGLGGLKIVELSQDFPALASGSVTLTTSGSLKSVTISDGTNTGQETLFAPGFLNYIKVWAPDNVSFATILVTELVPTDGTDTIVSIATEANDSRLLLGSTHSDSSSTIEIPLDKHNIGLAGNSAIGTEFITGTIERDISNLHINGIIRGFDCSIASSTSVNVLGGSAYINGKFVSRTRTDILITGVATSDGIYNLVLSSGSNFEVYNDANAGTSFEDLISNDAFVVLAQISVSSGTVSAVTDARLLINDGELRLPLTVDIRDLGAGNFRTLDAAMLYADNIPHDTKLDVHVFSDISLSSFEINPDRHVVISGDAAFSGAVILNERTILEIYGVATFGSTVSVGEHAALICHNTSTFSDAILCDDYSIISLYSDATIDNIGITGTNVKISGATNRPTVSFSGLSTGIEISGSDAVIHDLNLFMPNVAKTIVDLQSGSDGFSTYNVHYKQNYVITEINWSTVSRAGIKLLSASLTIANVRIQNCIFENFAEAISAHNASGNTWDGWLIDGCLIQSCGVGIYTENMENTRISNNVISFIRSNHINISNTASSIVNNVICNNVFELQSASAGLSLIVLSIGKNTSDLVIEGNVFRNLIATSAISVVSALSSPSGITVVGNIFVSCTTSDSYLVDMINVRSSSNFVGNNVINHVGKALKISDSCVANNNIAALYTLTTTVPSIQITNATSQPSVSGNIFNISGNQFIKISGSAVVSGNRILADHLTVDSLGAVGLDMTSNILDMAGTGTSTSVSLDTGATYTGQHIFAHNVIRAAATTNGLLLSLGRFLINGNSFTSPAGNVPTQLIAVGSGTTNSSASFMVENNLINADTGSTYAILIATNNVMVAGNYIYGSGMTNQAIFATSSKTNISITNNFLGGSGNALLIAHADGTSAQSFYVGPNKNYTDAIQQSSLLANQATGASWSVVSNALNTTTTGTLLLSLPALPIGSQIVSVSLAAVTNFATGVTITLLRRPSGSIATTSLGTATSSTTSFATITVAPSSTEYVKRGADYILSIAVSASPTNTSIGQAVVNLKY